MKEIDITKWKDCFPEKEPIVKVRVLSFGDYIDLQDKIADIKIVGSQQIVNPKVGLAKILMLEKSIVEAPFDVNEKSIRELPYDLGEFLFEHINDLNTVTPKK